MSVSQVHFLGSLYVFCEFAFILAQLAQVLSKEKSPGSHFQGLSRPPITCIKTTLTEKDFFPNKLYKSTIKPFLSILKILTKNL